MPVNSLEKSGRPLLTMILRLFINQLTGESDLCLLKEVFYLPYRDAEEQRNKEFQAALKIQCWFRGTKVRAYLK